MDPNEFLHRIYGRLDGLRQARQLYAPRLAPDFSSFNFILPDEMRLSKIVATLLSPSGNHAQGPAFLNTFLRRIDLEDYLSEAIRAKVNTEVRTNRIDSSMRRMDILIDFGESAVVIENKPWAADQNAQVKDYIKQLEISHPKKHCLLYLSGTDEPPSDDSIEPKDRETLIQEGKLLIKPYTILLDWLSDCKTVCQSERVRNFLDDFSNYIQQQFMGVRDMAEFDQIFDAVTASNEMFQTAMQVANSFNEIKRRLLKKLETQLDEKAKAKGWQLEWEIDYWGRNSYFGIFFFNEQQYYICFEFGGTQCQEWSYGITKKEGKLPDMPKFKECLSRIAPGEQSEWWPWSLYFDEPYRNWLNSHTPWIEIVDDCKLANMIIRKTEAIYKALKQDNLLDELR